MSEFRERVARKRQIDRRRAYLGIFVGFFVLLIGFFAVMQVPAMQRAWIYPYPHREIVEAYAEQYRVDSALVAAVIKTESKFRSEAHSHRGAVGLMQLMPDTAAWIAEQVGDASYVPHSIDALRDPQRNIWYGIWYLHSLQQEFHGNDCLALAAYNAGRGNVREWMQKYDWDYDFADISAIPYVETREYVRRVLESRKHYEALYPQAAK